MPASTDVRPSPGPGAGTGKALKRCPTCEGRYPADFNVCPRDATPLEASEVSTSDALIGSVLGDSYQVVRVIGEGGMGRVYEARHLRLRTRRFAVKVLHPEYAMQPDIVSRFEREAEAASGIHHPNVMDVYDVSTTSDGRPYFVGEYLEGEELGAYVRRAGRLAFPLATYLTRQVCEALGAAHARGIVHRDMKPENVFITHDDGIPRAKVIDFGISKIDSRETKLTKTGMILGTPSYMAPEQIMGEVTDSRVDVYAVGAMLYELLTGQPPFDSDDPTAVLSRALTTEAPRPRSIEASIPEGLELIVQRAMAKDARDRYQSMAELESALAPFDSGRVPVRPSAAEVQHDVQKQRSVEAARPTILGLGVALALGVTLGFASAVGGLFRLARDTELTGTEAALLVVGAFLVAASPAGLAVVYVKKNIWPNTSKAFELASDLRRTTFATFATYGALELLVRTSSSVLALSSATIASGAWDILNYVLALVAGAAAYKFGQRFDVERS
ncbi:MAG: serine/threonine-protein kinase [Polyangiaceae bacterium]